MKKSVQSQMVPTKGCQSSQKIFVGIFLGDLLSLDIGFDCNRNNSTFWLYSDSLQAKTCPTMRTGRV